MTLAEALAADRAGKIEDAARLYEAALLSSPEVDALVNLLVLYWQSTDYGIWTSQGLSREFVGFAGQRVWELIKDGRTQSVKPPEMRFWTSYISWADLGEDFDEAECRELLKQCPDYLEPNMFLLSVSQGREGERGARELLLQCKADPTRRNMYVASVIEALLERPPR